MPLLPDEWIQELLSRIDIREVVERYVPLQAKGSRYWACCPFHNEKTPSFSVTPDRGMFYCYGCHKGGTAIQFVSEIEKLGFREACEKLASDCGLDMPSHAYAKESQSRRRMMDLIRKVNYEAAMYFVEQLYTPDGHAALDYLKKRGLTDQDIRRNGLGYAPNDWQKTGETLISRGFEPQALVDAGLRKISKGRPYDVFRGRVIFPIIDAERSVIGFGGRAIDGSEPKYLNSPETLVFNKSRNVYHMNVIRQLRAVDNLILMEGYMDVVSADKSGIRNTVATLGTALTADQARLLKRWNVPVYICYDGDSPGLKAAGRAAAILEEAGVSCRVTVLPDGLDPDEFLKSQGVAAFETLVRESVDPIMFRFMRAADGLNLSRSEDMERYVTACISVLRGEASAIKRERFARVLADQTGYSLSSIMKDAERSKPESLKHEPLAARRGGEDRDDAIFRKAENYLALYAGAFPGDFVKDARELVPDDFTFEPDAAIVRVVQNSMSRGVEPTPEHILAILDNDEERSYAARLFDRIDDFFVQDKATKARARACVARLLLRRNEKERDMAMQKLRECSNDAERRDLKLRIQKIGSRIQELRQRIIR